jgi:hypothetical protein
MADGQVYVLTNEMIPGLVKVGKTEGLSTDRANGLSSATGVPVAFGVFKTYEVNDCDAAEKCAHRVLEASVGRPNKNREFFNGPAETVCVILDDALASYLSKTTDDGLVRFAEALRRVSRKEFTFACIEFEYVFSSTGIRQFAIQASLTLQKVYGTYLACCAMADRQPVLAHCVNESRMRDNIVQNALDTMESWTTDPMADLLPFIRKLS